MPPTLDPTRDNVRAVIREMLGESAKDAYGFKHDVTGSPATTGFLHGPGGILSWPGVDPQVFHTIVGSRSIMNQLPTKPSMFTNPTYAVITGVKDQTGSNPVTVCADPPTAGETKGGMIAARFGMYSWGTEQIDLGRVGQYNDRADPMDLQIIGSPIGGELFGSVDASNQLPGDILRNEVANRIFNRNVAAHRALSRQLWTANPANDTAGGGYQEFRGLDLLVATGYQDAETGLALPSLDSDIKNFNNLPVDANGPALVRALTYLWWTRNDLADRTGVTPVRFVFAMRAQTFYEITAVWACAYMTYRCNLAGANQTEFINPGDQIAMRDDMRAGKYLLIDGVRIPVVIDDGIVERTSTSGPGAGNAAIPNGSVSSDIYLLPMSVLGANSTLYLEYFQYQNPGVEDAFGNFVLGRVNGAFIEWPRQTNLCVVFNAKIRPRVVLRTPWLAGRLQNVVTSPLQFAREPFPTDPYYVNGGNTSRPPVSYYQD